MKKMILLTGMICLVAVSGFSAETLISGCEDVNFATGFGGFTAAADTVELSNIAGSEGTNGLQITYNYVYLDEGVAELAWHKDLMVSATFETPIDVSAMDLFKFDLNVISPEPKFMYTMHLIDDKGYQVRVDNYAPFEVASSGWETHTYKFSDLRKDQWATGGLPINLKKIQKVMIHIMNDTTMDADGTFVLGLDNIRFVSEEYLLNETTIFDFESYADSTELAGDWTSAFSGATPTLDTTQPNSGSQCMRLDADVATRWTNYAVGYTFAAPQDFSAAAYFKLAMYGDAALAGYTSTAQIFLEDVDGNRASALIYEWASDEGWSEIYMPFLNQGIDYYDSAWVYHYGGRSSWREDRWDDNLNWENTTDLSQISKIYLTISTQTEGNPGAVDLYFDDVRVGLASDAEPTPSVNSYTVNVIGPEDTAPVINGTVAAGEWDLAASPGCTGFVQHNANTTAASEDPEVKALFDGGYLYILYQVTNANFSLDFDPTGQTRDVSGTGFGGDDFELFIAPGGNMSDYYYHVVFFPDAGENYCYLWDEYGAGGAASWDASFDQAAFSYDSGSSLLTIEYRIRWTSFNEGTALATTAPANGDRWGMQIGYINNDPSEAVNWEPDATAGFAAGRPFGTWIFVGDALAQTSVETWGDYR